MKKYIVFFLTSLASLWIIDHLLPGVRFLGPLYIKFIVALAVTLGIFLTDKATEKIEKTGYVWFVLIGTLINFFMLYFATFIDGFGITPGSLGGLKIPVEADQILMLMVSSLMVTLIAAVTKWGMDK